jgi:hypothetical protein
LLIPQIAHGSIPRMTPELEKEIIVGVATAFFTGIPTAFLVWWTWARDQERLLINMLIGRRRPAGAPPSGDDGLNGMVIRNRSLFSVRISYVGFHINGQFIQLEGSLVPAKMVRNPNRASQYTFIADENHDPWEISSQSSTSVQLGAVDRPVVAAAIMRAATARQISVEELLDSPATFAIVMTETGKRFTSLSSLDWIRSKYDRMRTVSE